MGLLDRIGMVVKSNVNAIVTAAEDPEKILEQSIIDMQEDLVQLRQAVAQSMAALRNEEGGVPGNNSFVSAGVTSSTMP